MVKSFDDLIKIPMRIDWLVPFQYYDVFDDNDYSQLKWIGTKYDEDELMTI